MPRVGLTPAAVVAHAVELLDDGGELTLAAVAARAGVAVPSLYKHVRSLDALRDAVAVVAVEGIGDAIAAARVGRSGEDALVAAARAIRGYARAHPRLYALGQSSPAHEASPELAAQATRTVDELMHVVADAGVPAERAVDAVRIVRASVHGFVQLEAVGGFGLPDDVDATFERMLAVLWTGLAGLR